MNFFVKQALLWLAAPERVQLGIVKVMDAIEKYVQQTSNTWDDAIWAKAKAMIDVQLSAQELSKILVDWINKLIP